jgi:hypothetical protein
LTLQGGRHAASLAGGPKFTRTVSPGTRLFIVGFSSEWSTVEPPPFHGTDEPGEGEPKTAQACTRRMRRHLAATAVVLGLLAAPNIAPAKEITKVSVCGTTGECTTYDKSDFKTLTFLAEDAGPTDPPSAPAPWYRVRFTVDERDHGGGYGSWTVAYVPSANSLRVRDETGGFAWVALNPRTADVLSRAVRHLHALPKARLRGLDAQAPSAQVDEVFAPAAQRDRIDSEAAPWGWIAGGALAAALVLVTVALTVRRRRHIEVAPTKG